MLFPKVQGLAVACVSLLALNPAAAATTTKAAIAKTTTTAKATGAADAAIKTTLNKTISASQLLIDRFYDQKTGLFNGTWWNTGVVLTQLADLESYAPGVTKPTVPEILANTFQKAGGGGFLDGFYDDEGWWALAWIAAYDLTGQKPYLDRAADIWRDMTTGWRPEKSSPCDGGLWWDKKHTAEAGISNALFLSVSAHLATRSPANSTDRATYLGWARDEWAWMEKYIVMDPVGMSTAKDKDKDSTTDGSNSTAHAHTDTDADVHATANLTVVRDGVNINTCKPSTNEFTYVQGVTIGGLLELNCASPDAALLDRAAAIARTTTTIPRFNDKNGILTEPVGGYDSALSQFKGVFMRNLRLLQRHRPDPAFATYARRQADSMWAKSRQTDGLIAPLWDGLKYPADMSSHSSALAGLLAGEIMDSGYNGTVKVTRRAVEFTA